MVVVGDVIVVVVVVVVTVLNKQNGSFLYFMTHHFIRFSFSLLLSLCTRFVVIKVDKIPNPV